MKCMQIMKIPHYSDILPLSEHTDVPMHIYKFQNMVQ